MGEEYEVFEARIQMGFLLKTHNLLKMGVINMSIYTKEAFEYCLDNILEVRRKRCTYKNIAQTTMRKDNIILSKLRKPGILAKPDFLIQLQTTYSYASAPREKFSLTQDHFLNPFL